MIQVPSQTQEEQVLALASSTSLLRARDVAALSLPTIILSRLVKDGRLRRLARGVYVRPDQPITAGAYSSYVPLKS